MTVELGHYALILGVALAMLQALAPWLARWLGEPRVRDLGTPAALLSAALFALSFSILIHAFVVSDFSVSIVAENSHTEKPLIYRVSGAWGNHEGSMLMWLLMVAAYGAAVALFGRNLPASMKAYVLAVQGSIAACFGLFIVLASNPFLRLDPVPLEGNGLNPILQDPALAFHPPFLYAGYVGLSVAFSFAMAALIERRFDAAFALWVRPWTLAAWMSLTIGIAMGSWWAYYTLGWGGFWFWDPVENASLMPWLVATALLHSALVMERREALKIWTILLAILAFSFSLMGAFLVRSGVLTSVHSFAVAPARGLALLGLLVLFSGGALILFSLRVRAMRAGGLFAPISREGALVLNNLLLATSAATVLIGTLYPLVLESLNGTKISVGAPYFNLTFGVLMVPLLIAIPFGPLLSWKRGDLVAAAQRLWFALAAGLLVLMFVAAFQHRGPWAAPIGLALGAYLIVGATAEIVHRIQLGRIPWRLSMDRLQGLPRSVFGTCTAHAGVGLLVVGLVSTTAYQTERILVMKPGEKTELGGYTVSFRGVGPEQGPNYRAEVGLFDVSAGGTPVTELRSERRVYRAPPQGTTKAGIHVALLSDLYVVLGDPQAGTSGGYTVRAYFNPLVRLIWLGALVMMAGGLVSLSDRRLRIGAPRRSRKLSEPVQA